MDYSTLRTALHGWIARLMPAVNPLLIVWQNEVRPAGDGTMCILSWVSSSSDSQDETRWQDDETVPAPGSNLTPVQTGPRTLVLQVAVETFNHLPAAPNARAICDRVRDRVRLPGGSDLLADANLGLIETGPTIQTDYMADNHMVSRALFEVRLNAMSWEVGSADEAVGSIESVIVSSELTDPSGALLPAGEQLVNVEMP